MTTISNNRRRKRLSPSSIILISIFICCILAALLWRAPIEGVLWRALKPLFAARDSGALVASGALSQFASNSELTAQNTLLRAALASTSAALLDRDILYAENLELKARLGRTAAPASVIAAVITAPPAMPYDTLTLDIGKDHGLEVGDLVSAEGSVFIGTISQVYDTASRAVLFSSPGQTYAGLLRGTVPVSISGQGAGSFVGELPVGVEVAVGDPVLLPGISAHYMARVTGTVAREGESFKTLYLQLPINPSQLRFVQVHQAPN